MSETVKEQREQILETIVDDDLDGVVVKDDDTVLAKWNRENKTVKIIENEASYKILPDEDSVWDFELVSDAVRKRHPDLRAESLEERYEDNSMVQIHGSDSHITPNIVNFRETDGDIKLHSNSEYDNTVIEIYRGSNHSIRLDVEHGYVQYLQVYDHDRVPFEAVVDELRGSMTVERNRTNYNLGDL